MLAGSGVKLPESRLFVSKINYICVVNQRLLTYLLLFAFAVILTPRAIWHHHAGTEKACKHDDQHDHPDTDEGCYVCDFTLQPALTPVSFQFNFPFSNNYIAPAVAVALIELQEVSNLSLRGPPAAMHLCS